MSLPVTRFCVTAKGRMPDLRGNSSTTLNILSPLNPLHHLGLPFPLTARTEREAENKSQGGAARATDRSYQLIVGDK